MKIFPLRPMSQLDRLENLLTIIDNQPQRVRYSIPVTVKPITKNIFAVKLNNLINKKIEQFKSINWKSELKQYIKTLLEE